jgi:Transposase DDE domain
VRHLQASSRLANHLDWPGLAQVCRLERTTVRSGQTTLEVQYAVTSVPPDQADAAALLRHWRGHWGIENRLHWVRDVAYREDHCGIRTKNAPQNLAAFRNAAITLLRLSGLSEITPALRRFAIQPQKLLRFLRILKN